MPESRTRTSAPPFLVSDALLLPVGIRGEELGGALAYFGSGEVIQIDVEVKERAFFDDDLSAGCGVADQAGFLAERDLEAVAFDEDTVGRLFHLKRTFAVGCGRATDLLSKRDEGSVDQPAVGIEEAHQYSLPADQLFRRMTRRPF